MIRGTSRTPSPLVGVTTRRTMLHGRPMSHGIQGDHNRERSGPLSAALRIGSSESSAKSTERSPSEDYSVRRPQSNSGSSLPQSMNTGRSNEVPCPTKPPIQPNLKSRDAQQSCENHGTVDEVVYYSARSLAAVHPDEDFTFFGDVPRMTIVVKWMRFYQYYPNTDKATDKVRRDELKAHLNIPSGNGQKLGQFIINKFNSFRKWGYLYWDGNDHIIYYPSTDLWLSPTWDGHIERHQVSTTRESRPPSTQGGARKRQASTRGQQGEKRQKSMDERRAATSPVTTKTAPLNISGDMNTLSPPLPSQHPFMTNEPPSCGNYGLESENHRSFHDNQRNSQDRTETIIIGRKQERTVDGSTNHTSTAAAAPKIQTITLEGTAKGPNPMQPSGLSNDGVTGLDKVGKYPLRGRDLAPNPEELSARLEAINPQSTSGIATGISSSNHLSGSAKHIGTLGVLRAKEKSCIQTLRESMKELDTTREKHKKLCQQYETLKAEFRDTLRIIEHNSMRRKAVAPPTPLGTVEATFADRLQDVLQNGMKDGNFLRVKQEEKSSLETQIAETAEAKSNLKSGIAAKKIELKQLQGDIKDTLKVNAKLDVFAGELRVLLDDCKDVGGGSRSGTTSPVESVSESVSSEIDGVDQLSETSEPSELSDLDSNDFHS